MDRHSQRWLYWKDIPVLLYLFISRHRHSGLDEDLYLPYLESASLPSTNRESSNHYEWEFPLPPPPAKDSRTNVAAIKKQHDHYCKYYALVKKKLHLYTSVSRNMEVAV